MVVNDHDNLPHVSTISKVADDLSGLVEWAKDNTREYCDNLFKERGEFGTRVHGDVCDAMVGFEGVDFDEDTKPYVFAIMRWADFVGYKSRASEKMVVSNKHGWVGTYDDHGEIDGELELIDWKITSAIRLSHKIQPVGYIQGLLEQENINIRKWRLIRPYALKTKAKATGIKKTKNGWKYSFAGSKIYIEEQRFDCFDEWLPVFLSCKQILEWRNNNESYKPNR